jgi:F-type H+-transporting ATPase subunit delta
MDDWNEDDWQLATNNWQLIPMSQDLHITPLSTAYARSLLELANAQNQAKEIGQELKQIAGIAESYPMFASFLGNRAISEAHRAGLLEKVFRGRVSELLMNFLLVANRKGRLSSLPLIAATYDELLDQQLGIVEVDVVVAYKLGPEELEAVGRKIGQTLKREVVVHQYIDESIIGGLVLRMEDRLLDASVRAQLNAIRRKLLAARVSKSPAK